MKKTDAQKGNIMLHAEEMQLGEKGGELIKGDGGEKGSEKGKGTR